MKSIFIVSVFFVLAICACSRKSAPVNDERLEISHSTICGWCTGGDSLIVKQAGSVYLSYKSCDISTAEKASKPADAASWNELVALLDIKKFNAIHLNICNVCADGCDARVTIKQGGVSHSISYGSIDNPEVADIKLFLQKLMDIRNKYKEKVP